MIPGIHVRRHKDLLWLILDRTNTNELTQEMLEQLAALLRLALKKPPQLVVITGAGEQAFCTGVDASCRTAACKEALLHAAAQVSAAFEELRAHTIPTVALVKGLVCDAGCELAFHCDTVIAREDAQFKLPTLDSKLFPSLISVYLPAVVGHETATRLLQSGTALSAREAMHLGLVHQVLSSKRFLSDAEDLLVLLAAVN